MSNGLVGLFLLKLHTKNIQPGGVTLTLTLTVSTPNDQVTGHSSVTQAVNPPLDVQSHVIGTLIHEFVMPPSPSHQRINLTGYPIIQFPPNVGIGPVILPNFKSIIVLNETFSEGVANFSWRDTFAGAWHTLTQDVVKF